jgi:glutathione S-transferase
MLPVAVVRGRVISESNDIMMALEKEFPYHHPLLPEMGNAQKARVRPLLQLERQVFGCWFSWLTAKDRHDSRAKEMESVLQRVDRELSTGSVGPFFLGADISLVDIMFAPFLERMAASLPYFKGFTTRHERFPALLRWYEAMDVRTHTYGGIKSDYYTHCMDLPPQIGRCWPSQEGEAEHMRAEIDGFVPAAVRTAIHEPMLPLDAGVASRDAARRAVMNRAKLVRFAARGAVIVQDGRGPRAVSAPLSDPGMRSEEVIVPAVDAALRCALADMLRLSSPSPSPQALLVPAMPVMPLSGAANLNTDSDAVLATQVAASLAYLRDRIGVPRDMTPHAAQQMRQSIAAYVSRC